MRGEKGFGLLCLLLGGFFSPFLSMHLVDLNIFKKVLKERTEN